jgi:iron complex transport system substrate-binding protein
MYKIFFILITFLVFYTSPQAKAYDRIVSIGGDVTEVIYAINKQDKLVGADTTSYFPPEVNRLPKVGYKRTLSAEGILSLKPDLIIHSGSAGPQSVIKQLKATGVEIIKVDDGHNFSAIKGKLEIISEKLGAEDKKNELIQKLESQYAELGKRKEVQSNKKSAIFVLSHTGDRSLVAGKNSSAEGFFTIVGIENAIEDFNGFKPLNPESLVSLNPDYIILSKTLGTKENELKESLLKTPGIEKIKAVEEDNIIFVDAMRATGFGSRTIEAALELNGKIYE